MINIDLGEDKDTRTKIKDLKPGDAFLYKGVIYEDVYLKVELHDQEPAVINLKTCQIAHIDFDVLVRPVDLNIQVIRDKINPESN